MPRDDARKRNALDALGLPKLTLEDQRAIALYGRNGPRSRAADIAGKVWAAPNTALGLAYGLAGHAVGKAMGKDPRIGYGGNAIQFVNNPFGGASAITLGNATIWNGNPYDRDHSDGPDWHDAEGRPRMDVDSSHTYPEHEEQHTRQSEQLGPLYLPSNLLGGAYGLVRDKQWHGEHNWNEAGPMSDPSRPWRGSGR